MGNLISLLDGVLIGFVYGLSAMGLSLIWGVMKVINLSHGAMMALGMFFSYQAFSKLGINPYLALPGVAVFGMLIGLLIYGVAVHRVLSGPHLSSLLATFAVNMIIIGVGTAVFSTSPRNIDYSAGAVVVGDIRLPGTRLLAAAAAILFAALLYLFLYRTRSGKAIRAVANNREAAELMGIAPTRSLALSFGIGTSLAALAGGLIATFFPFTILSGGTYELKSFVICVLGGLGNPLGALLGGLILGGIEGVIPTFMPVSWVPVVEFGLFILVLVLRPGGLLGEK
ncbi:MAG: branched-chain amino acid ABC transporter permease [Verrucomicrobiae bacterium]